MELRKKVARKSHIYLARRRRAKETKRNILEVTTKWLSQNISLPFYNLQITRAVGVQYPNGFLSRSLFLALTHSHSLSIFFPSISLNPVPILGARADTDIYLLGHSIHSTLEDSIVFSPRILPLIRRPPHNNRSPLLCGVEEEREWVNCKSEITITSMSIWCQEQERKLCK